MGLNVMNDSRALTLADEDFQAIKAFGKRRSVARGESLWESGDLPDTLYVVQSGKANMVIGTADGKEAIVHYCAHAQTFCMAAAVSGKAYPCTATAASDMEVLAIPRARFQEVYQRLPNFARQIMGAMSEQLCESHRQAALSTVTVKERLADLLGRLHKDFVGRELPFTRQELANMTGTTVESAIRALSEWEKSGVIRTERGQIKVCRPDALLEVAA